MAKKSPNLVDRDNTQKKLRDMLIGDPKADQYDKDKFKVLFSSFSSKWLQRFRFAELNSAQNENLFSLLFDRGKAAVIKVAPEKLIAFKDPQSEYDYLVFSDFSVSYHNNPTDLNGSDLYIKLQKDKAVIPITTVFDRNYKVGVDAAIMYIVKGSVISIKATIETYCAKMAVIEKQIESYSKTAIVNVTFNQAVIRDQDLRKDIIENIRRNEPIIFTQAEGIQNNGEMIAKLRTEYSCLKNELNIFLGWNAMAQQEKKEHFIQSELDSSIEEAEIFAKRYIDSLNCFAQHIEDVFGLKLTLIDTVEEIRNKMMLSNIKKQMAVTLSSQATINKNAKSSQFESVSSSAGYTNGNSTSKDNGFRMKGIGGPNSSGGDTGSSKGLGGDDSTQSSGGESSSTEIDIYTPTANNETCPAPINSQESNEFQTANNFFEFYKNRKREQQEYFKDVTSGISQILSGLGGAAAINEIFRKPGFINNINAQNPTIAREAAKQFELENYRRLTVDRILRQNGINNFGRETDIFVQQHEFFEHGMQEYRDFIRRFFQRQALGYQRYFDGLQVEQIEQIFIDSENMIFEIENIFNQMIEGEPVNQNLASEIVQQFQINREIKTFKDLEKVFNDAISLHPKENEIEHVSSHTIEAIQKKYTKLFKEATNQFWIDKAYKYRVTPEEVKYFTLEALNLKYQIDNQINLMIKEELKKVNLVEEKTNSFSIKGFESLKISPLVASIFLAGRSPLARRLLANMRLELINSRMAVEGFNFMLDGIQQGAQNVAENPSYLSGLLWLLSLIGGVGGAYYFSKKSGITFESINNKMSEIIKKFQPSKSSIDTSKNRIEKIDEKNLIYNVAKRNEIINQLSKSFQVSDLTGRSFHLEALLSSWFYDVAVPLKPYFGSLIYPNFDIFTREIEDFLDPILFYDGKVRSNSDLSRMVVQIFKIKKDPDNSLMNEIKLKYKKVADDLEVPDFSRIFSKEYSGYKYEPYPFSFMEEHLVPNTFLSDNRYNFNVVKFREFYYRLNWDLYKKWRSDISDKDIEKLNSMLKNKKGKYDNVDERISRGILFS